MKRIVTNIFKVKSIITLALTAVFVYLAIKRDISSEQFMTIFTATVFSLFKNQSGDNNK